MAVCESSSFGEAAYGFGQRRLQPLLVGMPHLERNEPDYYPGDGYRISHEKEIAGMPFHGYSKHDLLINVKYISSYY